MEPYVMGFIPAAICFVVGIGLMLYVGTHDPENPRAHPQSAPR
jgi:hypothetical protein